ncbi:DegT/DnrJ/EryC1/StrS family aminotransferase [Flavobacterium pectinovorum]|uniref:DegT/DnrJ/EryC1/StrS family aminotransferase n=1 Tax=Flavobacterium pectinovorum TaxID=29533 RepID=UPI001FAC2E81|nr:DegT/DnrJ/EryC1/StrS family aminotransferase [Flavobacterium pectinovorum]MCI9843882.1 DegT/DnrJ/EryC1/StrS family aminotransferase [Flavobacterium pectinovorum]
MIPVNTPLLSGNELKYVSECIETGWISSEGPFISRFETQFAQYVNRRHGIAVANGSAALDIAVKGLGIGTGDEVIMPSFTIISPAQSVVTAGATPVLVDSDPVTWNMDVSQIEAKITSKTKAILVVHIYGLPVDMDPVLALCEKYNLKLIEDAAEMHGQTYKGKMCGSFGDISIFSFYPNKHITTGEGGMLVCNDENLVEQCKKLRNLAFEPKGRRFIHHELGWNYRMTNLQAALGVAQLEKIEYHIQRKREIGTSYSQKLKKLAGFQLPLEKTDYAENIYWVFGLVADSEEQQEAMVKKLAEAKIGTRPFFWCMHEQPVFKKMGLFENETYPVAEKLARNGFYIPSGLGLSDEDIDKVVSAII